MGVHKRHTPGHYSGNMAKSFCDIVQEIDFFMQFCLFLAIPKCDVTVNMMIQVLIDVSWP